MLIRSVSLICFAVFTWMFVNALRLVIAYNVSESLNGVDPFTYSYLHIAQLCLCPLLIVVSGALNVTSRD